MSEKNTPLYRGFPLGRNFAILTRYYFGALSKRLEHLDVERHYSILIFIGKTEKNCTQQFISDYFHKDKATMVRITDYLVKKGYVIRVANPEDRREYHLKLTVKGKSELPEIQKTVNELNKAAVRGLTKEQSTDFYEMLETIYENLGNEPAYGVELKLKKTKISRK